MKAMAFLLFASLLTPAFGQSHFRRGFLVTNERDTVRGLISFDEDVAISTPCYYKSNAGDAVSAYAPGAISGFQYENDNFFTSRSIGKSADVFLEVLAKGTLSLYKFHDIYFIEKGDSAFFELSDDVEDVQIDGGQVRTRTKNYTRMLLYMMGDCMDARRIVPATLLKKKSLVKLISIYNTCKGNSNSTNRNQTK